MRKKQRVNILVLISTLIYFTSPVSSAFGAEEEEIGLVQKIWRKFYVKHAVHKSPNAPILNGRAISQEGAERQAPQREMALKENDGKVTADITGSESTDIGETPAELERRRELVRELEHQKEERRMLENMKRARDAQRIPVQPPRK